VCLTDPCFSATVCVWPQSIFTWNEWSKGQYNRYNILFSVSCRACISLHIYTTVYNRRAHAIRGRFYFLVTVAQITWNVWFESTYHVFSHPNPRYLMVTHIMELYMCTDPHSSDYLYSFLRKLYNATLHIYMSINGVLPILIAGLVKMLCGFYENEILRREVNSLGKELQRC
jgi:hypothetical protein